MVGAARSLSPSPTHPLNMQDARRGWAVAMGVLGFICIVWSRSAIVAERILAVRDVGLQLETERRDGTTSSRFVDATRLRTVIINEAVSLGGVSSYAALVVDGLEHLVVLVEVRPEPCKKRTRPTVAYVCVCVCGCMYTAGVHSSDSCGRADLLVSSTRRAPRRAAPSTTDTGTLRRTTAPNRLGSTTAGGSRTSHIILSRRRDGNRKISRSQGCGSGGSKRRGSAGAFVWRLECGAAGRSTLIVAITTKSYSSIYWTRKQWQRNKWYRR